MRRALLVTTVVMSMALLPAVGASAATTQLQQDTNQLQSAGPVSVVSRTVVNGVNTAAVAGTTTLGGTVAPSVNTHYRQGSITKTFVSTVILQLVGSGKMSLSDTVAKWLPGLITQNGNDGTKITVQQLLQHTSGLPDYASVPSFFKTIDNAADFYANNTHQYAPTDLVNIAQSQAPLFAPGSSWSYSNTNYIVAGMIIQKVTGNNWATEVNNRIIGPLKLTSTSIPTGTGLPTPFADGYNIWSSAANNRVYSDTTQDNMSWADSAGAIISDTQDEITFFTALIGGKLLPAAQLTQMETLVPIDSRTGYGLGLAHTNYCGKDVWWHDGGTIGYDTNVVITGDLKNALAYDVSTSNFTGSDTTFNSAVTGQEDQLTRHALCGASYTGTDSITAEETAVHKPPTVP